MSLAEQLQGAAWVADPRWLRWLLVGLGAGPAFSFLKLEGAPVAGRIRPETGLRSRRSIELAGWEGQAKPVRRGGMVLVDRTFGQPVASCERVSSREVCPVTADGRRFKFEPQFVPPEAKGDQPAAMGGNRVVDEAGSEVLSIITATMPPSGRWPLSVSADLDDALALHLVALSSAMAIKVRHMQRGTKRAR